MENLISFKDFLHTKIRTQHIQSQIIYVDLMAAIKMDN